MPHCAWLALCRNIRSGPEPGLTRDPTYGWIKHGSLNLQLVDTAGWKKATALQPTQSPTAPISPSKAGGSSSRGTLSSSSRSPGKGGAVPAAAGAVVGEASEEELEQQQQQQQQRDAVDVMLGKQLADASLAQARRALGACHVAVLLLDAARLLTIEQVCDLCVTFVCFGGRGGCCTPPMPADLTVEEGGGMRGRVEQQQEAAVGVWQPA